jgi:ABC-2 type transport system ATP-binding protein
MIQTEHVRKSYGRKVAVKDLSLRVEPGEILGFLGPNGAGKSTTVKILSGLVAGDGGRALVAGFDVARQPQEVKKRLGVVLESPTVYDALTADEYLELVGCLHHLAPATSAARREELLDVFSLAADRHQRLKEFSKGMRQKVVIAAALIHKPDVLILDEPLDGIDANTALVVKELLRKLAAQGKTVLFSSHILEVVERITTRIFIIDKGRHVLDGTADDIRRETGTTSLDEAFAKLTGVRDAGQVTAEFLAALDRA